MNHIKRILETYCPDYAVVSMSRYINERAKLKREDFYDQHYETISSYKTIVTCCFPYPQDLVKWGGKGHGLLSRYSYGEDYHRVVKRELETIDDELNKLGIETFSTVDTGLIDERFAAYLSGLGFLGKNQFLIHPTFGTHVYLATILLKETLAESKPVLESSCGDCTLCIDACPSGALDHGFNISKCISEISQVKKELSIQEIGYFKTMIYGCDICQRTCPKNSPLSIHKYPEFEPTGIERMDLIELMNMSNKEYYAKYKENASSWRGPLVLKRNAAALAYNQNLKAIIPHLEKSLHTYQDVLWYNETIKTILRLFKERER
jgi:epoxyqueuosine reductase